MRQPGPLSAIVGLALLAAACDGSPLGEGYPTAIELTADRATATVDQQVIFRYEARGRNLAGIVLDYGDGTIDSIPAFAAQTAAGNRTHRYDAAGTFIATAEVIEAAGSKAMDEVALEIVEAPES